jgi:mannitol-1-/sugar-/sorbitol-6-phosphatase
MIFPCDAILFDLDGTLVDSNEAVVHQWQNFATRHGLQLADILAVSHGRQTGETMRIVAPHIDVEEEVRAHHRAEIENCSGVRPVHGAAELLSALREDEWAVVTACPRKLAEARIRAAGLPLPRHLIPAELVSRGKPHPDGFLLGAERLGVAPARCLVLEDAHTGIEAGLAAGMAVIGVATTFPRERLKATACVDDLTWLTLSRGTATRLIVSVGEPR